eukprot:m.656188 g.656188  ORF g.656188 m.656188 type:complete len:111 (+) comp22700_c0_seq9:1565-1897(+)
MTLRRILCTSDVRCPLPVTCAKCKSTVSPCLPVLCPTSASPTRITLFGVAMMMTSWSATTSSDSECISAPPEAGHIKRIPFYNLIQCFHFSHKVLQFLGFCPRFITVSAK